MRHEVLMAVCVVVVVVVATAAPAHGDGSDDSGGMILATAIGPSFIDKYEADASQLDVGVHAGFGYRITPRWRAGIAYERHGFSDETPLQSDVVYDEDDVVAPPVVVHERAVFRTQLILLGVEWHYRPGLYARGELGVGQNDFARYAFVGHSGMVIPSAGVSSEDGWAAGLAAGYEHAFHRNLAVAAEVYARESRSLDSEHSRRVIGLRLAARVSFQP